MKCSAKWGKGIAFRTRYEESETQSGIESKTESWTSYEIECCLDIYSAVCRLQFTVYSFFVEAKNVNFNF